MRIRRVIDRISPRVAEAAAIGTAGAGLLALDSDESEAQRRFVWRLLAILAGLVVIISLTGFFHLKRQQTSARADVYNNLNAIADLKNAQIVDWRRERLSDGRFLLSAPFVAEDVAALLATPGATTARTRVFGWLNLMKSGDRYESAWLFDPSGNLRLAIPETNEAPGAMVRALLAATLRASDATMTDLHRADENGPIHLELLVPVFEPGARPAAPNLAPGVPPVAPIAVIMLRLNPERFLFPLIQTWPMPSTTAETLLVRREGDEVVYLNELRHHTGTALALRRPVSDPLLPAAMVTRGEHGVFEGVDYRGVPVLAAVRTVPDSPWMLVAKVDQAEAYAPIRAEARRTGLMVVLLLAIVVLAAAYLWRQRHATLLRHKLTAERERQALADRLGLVTRYANDIILLSDESGRILEANDRALATYGYTLDELRQKTLHDVHAAEARESLPQQLELLHSLDGALFNTVHQRKDGTAFPVEVSGRFVEIEGRQCKLGIIRDITQRKAHEREIERLNRLYVTLSQINQSIVRVQSSEELFREVCRIAVECAGFKLVWIGSLDRETYAVKPVRRAGASEGYLDKIDVYADDRPEGRDPAGTCIREGRPCIVNDFASDPRAHSWQEAATAHGLRSVAAMPIRSSGEIWGAFTVYAAEAGAFQDREIALLEETALDLSFALDHLRQEERRRQTEAALSASEVRYRRLFESAKDGILILDADTGTVVDVNPFLVEILGFSREKFLGQKVWELGFFKDILANQTNFEELQQKEYIRYEDMPLKTSDGRRIEVEFVSNVYLVNRQKVIQCNIRDITERKRAEAALRESERRLSEAQKLAQLGHWIWDVRTGKVEWSEEVFKIFHLDPVKFTPRIDSILALSPWPEDHERDKELIRRAMESHEKGTYDQRFLRPDGSTGYYYSTFQGNYDDGGNLVSIVGTILDITERKRAEGELRQLNETLEQRVHERTADLKTVNSQLRDEIAVRQQAQQAQERLVAILEATPDFVGFADAKSAKILYMNRAGRRMTGCGEEQDVTTLSIIDVHPDWANQKLRDEILPTAARDGVWTGECAFRHRNGREIPVLMVLLAHKTPSGEVAIFSTISRDITTLKRTQEEINRLNLDLTSRAAQLEAVNQELEAFSYSVSHDLRAPLRGIDGWAQALLDDFGDKLGEAGRQLLQRQRAASQRMGTLIEDLLRLSRLTRQPLTRQTVSPAALVHQVWEELRPAQPPQTAELVVGALPDCQADSSLLTQVFTNLLGNALKFSNGQAHPRIEVGSQTGPDHECVFFVKDNGAGFDMRYAHKLFGAFQRLHSAHEFHGTGIGLAITQRIIRRHGGRIWAESAVGHGATFFFTLKEGEEVQRFSGSAVEKHEN